MHFMSKTMVSGMLLAMSSVSSFAATPTTIDISGVYSRGNVESGTNNVVEYTLGAGVNDFLTQIDFSTSVLANAQLFFGTTIGDLSVLVSYQDGVSSNSVDLGFKVDDLTFISSATPDSLSGSLESSSGTPYQFTGWHLKSGGKLTFAFNELYDDANADGLTGADYWDAQYQPGSSLTLQTVPVPEPETYALMLAGLGLVGFLAKRRKNMA